MKASAILRELIAAGLSGDALVLAIERIEDASDGPETALEKRRAYDRERKRKKTNSTGIPPETAESNDSENGDHSTGIPPEFHRKGHAPHARVEDKPLRLVPTCNPISSFCDDDWPKDEPHGFAKRLAMLAGPGLGDPAKEPGLTTTSPEIIRWRQMGCSWSLDVVPTIQARTLKARDRPITGWNLLTRDVRAAKARREKPVDIPTISSGGQFMSSGQQAAAMRREGVENLLRKLESE